jgi:hypothetical protein
LKNFVDRWKSWFHLVLFIAVKLTKWFRVILSTIQFLRSLYFALLEDVAEEIRTDLEMEEERLESGMPPDEAHYAALRRFGNVTVAQERNREMWRWSSVETLWQDFRHGRILHFAALLPKSHSIFSIGVGSPDAAF